MCIFCNFLGTTKVRPVVLSFIILAFICRQNVPAQTGNSCRKAKTMVNVLQKAHYNPPPLNDSLSSFLFDETIRLLDSQGLYFTQESLQDLAGFRYQLDEEINQQDCYFQAALTQVYKQQLETAEQAVGRLLEEPLPLNKKDTLWIHYGSTSYAPNLVALQKRWEKWLKFHVLQQLAANSQETPPALSSLILSEPEARQQAGQKAICQIRKPLDSPGGIQEIVSTAFLNALASYYDPHTIYFSASEKQVFESALAKEALSYGFELATDDFGTISISKLAPGGPAWKSGKLYVGDILLGLQEEGEEPLNINCLSVQELRERLQAVRKPLRLHIRKTNGQAHTVSLLKDKLEVEENKINSLILTGEKKIGYLFLPGFYTSWEEENPLGCANDVAREILKLKKEKMEGLILDLRFNAGGATAEAIDLAGLFIDEGTLGINRHQDEKPRLIKDINRGTAYDGPMLVLVNSLSASAAELIAASLQDYSRAVIVGSPTYGKASGQIILPLHPSSSPGAINTSEDYIKVTTDKLYRISGKTHQKTGVIPDIHLPDLLEAYPIRENTKPRALSSDEIQKKVFYTPLPPLPLKELRKRSSERIYNHETFMLIKEEYVKAKTLAETGEAVALNLEAFLSKEENQLSAPRAHQKEAPFKISYTDFNPALANMNPVQEQIKQETIRQLEQDIYLLEAYHILHNLITLTTKK